jgi:Tol biopolymer transport system component
MKARVTALKLMMSFLVALLLLPLAMQGAQAAPGDIILCSSNADWTEADATSFWARISSDGRYVVFSSSATNLVPGVTGMQIYRKDLVTGEVLLASADAGGKQGNGNSDYPAISDDGRYIAFQSGSTNLVTPNTTNDHVFRKDMLTGEVLLASADATDVEGNNQSLGAAISGDGRYVAFYSAATNLVTPNTTNLQVFRKDLLTGEVLLASASTGGVQGDSNSFNPAITDNGRYVAFHSIATDLVTPNTSFQQVFLKDLMTGEIQLVSKNAAGVQADSSNGYPSVSSCDARYISFASVATNLVTGVTGQQIYRKDMATGAVVLVSSDAGGKQGDAASLYSSISADGRYVAFDSTATNLVTPATLNMQVYRKDISTGDIILASSDAGGAQGNGASYYTDMTDDSRYITFFSGATNLVTPITNPQIFCKELSAPYYFYFAEGYTQYGYQEYLCLGNPGAAPMDVHVTYLFRNGTTQEETYNVPADSRLTVDVNAAIGDGLEVSIKCEAADPYVAERPMYFDYQNAWTGGHDVVGVPAPACTWYFAEGYTGAGFEEWICILNPGDLPAELTFRFQTQEEGEKTVSGFVASPNSRVSLRVNDLLGGGSYQTSLKLESNHPIVAERPMYFSYSGTGDWGWTGGHCVMGASSLANDYYFAEGTTRAGFEEWLTIQNPGDEQINVHATYNLGTGTPVETDTIIDPGRRTTIYVPDQIGTEQDASVHLSSESYFLAERPMYFDYQGLGSWGWTGGHCVIGANSPASDWFFAEGYTGAGFEEWLCIQNPNTADAQVSITYYLEGGTLIVKPPIPVPGGTRFTVAVNMHAGTDLNISAKVHSIEPIIVERPMYFNFRDIYPGGHDVLGFVQ